MGDPKASPWWYGPFTIRNFTSKGAASLASKRGGVVTASIERLRYPPPDNEVHLYQGYVIMRDDDGKT